MRLGLNPNSQNRKETKGRRERGERDDKTLPNTTKSDERGRIYWNRRD